MQFGLSEEQVLLQDTVKRFLTDNVPLERVRKYSEDGSDADIWPVSYTHLTLPTSDLV